ncbi:fumarylacetoacetate hydrolase family protein, partial [Variovorax sp. RHLX14]
MITSRRGLLAGSAAMATGAIAGCALPAGASRTQATPFD